MVPSGVQALDRLLSGGFPTPSAVLVEGRQGTGRELLAYSFVQSKFGEDCRIFVTRSPVVDVVRDARAKGLEVEAGVVWVAGEGGEASCNVEDLASLSFSIKGVLRKNGHRKTRIVFDALSAILMRNPPQNVYRFIDQLIGEIKRYDAVLLATIELDAHPQEVVASIEHLFDGVVLSEVERGRNNASPLLRVVQMKGVSVALNASAPLLQQGGRTQEGMGRDDPASSRRRLAVLPFANIGPDGADEYLADGLTEEIISSLSRLPHLRVVARTSVMTYKGTGKTVSQVGSELGVGAVLEGSVRKNAGKLRVVVQLVDAASEEYIWSQTYNREIDDFLSVQQDIAEKTVEALKPRLESGEDAMARPRRITDNPQAFLLYLQGRYHFTRYSQPEVVKAAELFEQATKLDAGFASAYAMCAQCHMFLGFFGFIAPSEGFAKARPLLKKALEIDDGLDLAHMLMGRLLMDEDWDWAGAEAELRSAIRTSPNSAEAHYRYALLLNDLCRNTEALAEVRIAEELDPLSVAVNQISGSILYFAGRTEDAIERLERAIEMDPRAALAHNNLGLALCKQGKVEEGVEEVKQATELDPKNAMFRTDLCYAYATSGRLEEAKRVLVQAEGETGETRVAPVAVAGMYACLNDADRALEWLQRAYEEHSPYLASLKVEKWFDTIRSDPKFVAIVRGVGLG